MEKQNLELAPSPYSPLVSMLPSPHSPNTAKLEDSGPNQDISSLTFPCNHTIPTSLPFRLQQGSSRNLEFNSLSFSLFENRYNNTIYFIISFMKWENIDKLNHPWQSFEHCRYSVYVSTLANSICYHNCRWHTPWNNVCTFMSVVERIISFGSQIISPKQQRVLSLNQTWLGPLQGRGTMPLRETAE